MNKRLFFILLGLGLIVTTTILFTNLKGFEDYKSCLIESATMYCEDKSDSFGGLRKDGTMFLCNDHSNLRGNTQITSAYGQYFTPDELVKCEKFRKDVSIQEAGE